MPTSEPLAGSAFIRAIADDLNGNRMIRRLFDADGDFAVNTSNRMYIHDGMQIVQIFDRPSSTTTLTDRLLWSDQTDHLISDERVTSLSNVGTVYWSLANHLGNIVDVATYDPGTDTTSIVKHRKFDSFGNITLDSATGVIFVMGYTGKFLDSTTGLQNNINRWYAAPLGEWMTEDPIGFDGGDENLGRYVRGNPINATDPSGLLANEIYQDIYDQASLRRGKGPWGDSAQHCWAAAYITLAYGPASGILATFFADYGELERMKNDWKRDILAQHVGVSAAISQSAFSPTGVVYCWLFAARVADSICLTTK